jgi:hypothetical protein
MPNGAGAGAAGAVVSAGGDDVPRDLGRLLAEGRRLADAVLGPLAAADPRAARLRALVRELEERLGRHLAAADLADAADDEDGAHPPPGEIVELLVMGSRAPLRVTAAVADAVWNTMFVKEPTTFVDVVLAEGGVARIRPSAVTGFRYHPGTAPPEGGPPRRGRG